MRLREISIVKNIWSWLVGVNPRLCVRLYYFWMLKRFLHLCHPRDINEKIQWLKFHEDMDVWAMLADKYAVREYVKQKGLDKILVALYGKYETVEDLMSDWEKYPQSFVIKSNNGSYTVIIVEDKNSIDKAEIEKKLSNWLSIKDYGTIPVELHYNKINPCLIVEELLVDSSVKAFSRSLVDYKIWCFNGNPHHILVVYDRGGSHKDGHILDCYDLNWKKIRGAMTNEVEGNPIPKPHNFEMMMAYARTLSSGHKQMRVDLYNIQGKIYFGELTMTSMGGYMDYYTKEFLLEMGNHVDLE